MKIFKRAKTKKEENILLALSIVLVILFVLIFAGTVIESLNASEVKILTDKRKYKEGDIIKITISNETESSIFLKRNLDRIWDIQIVSEGDWTESKVPVFGDQGRYILELKSVDTAGKCFYPSSIFNKILEIKELVNNEKIELEWNQFGCLFSSRDVEKYAVRAQKGTYRIYLEYFYESIDENGDVFDYFDTAYSKPFYIK